MTSIATAPVSDQVVASRAYALWEAEGRPHGRDRDHWARAERDVAVVVEPEALAAPQPAPAEVARAAAAAEEAPIRKPARRRVAKAGA